MTNKFVFIILLLFIMGSCEKPNQSKIPEIKVAIEQLKSKDEWRVDYKINRPVYALAFKRQTYQFREKNWNSLDPAFNIRNEFGQELISRLDNKPFDSISFRFKSYYSDTPNDYPFFVPFSNNDILMYLGHYSVFTVDQPLKDLKFLNGNNAPIATELFSIRSQKNLNLIIDGKKFKEFTQWENSSKSGTYIFIGENQPLIFEDLLILIDKDIPSWVYNLVQTGLPQILSYYKKRLGLSLPFKPVVYLNFDNKQLEFTSSSGGILPGVIQFSLKGKSWQKKSEAGKEWIYWYLAHESAHFWNAQYLQKETSPQTWMLEGSADALAYRALRDLKLVSEKSYRKMIDKEKKSCFDDLRDNLPLIKSNIDNFYMCGHMINLLVESSLTEMDLFDFWRLILNNEINQNKKYSDEEFFTLWRKHSNNNEIILDTESFLYKDSKKVKALFQKL